MESDADHFLDITGDVCPLTFVRTKLVIEKMRVGETLEVRLRGAEPLRNVPRSVAELGHSILSVEIEAGQDEFAIHRLKLRKER